MSDSPSTVKPSAGSTVASAERLTAAEQARCVADAWEKGERLDLPTAVRERPGILADRSIFLDLAQREFRESPDRWADRPPSSFCDRFRGLDPDLMQTLHRMIEVEHYLGRAGLSDLIDTESERDWPHEGQRFGKFDLIEELGRGSLGRVFLARQPSLGGRSVVVKVTRSMDVEAAALGNLDHPNVVPIHDADVDAATGLGWICMPFLGRRTLHRVVNEYFDDVAGSPQHEERASREYLTSTLGLFLQLTDGLAYLHGRDLVHGDLKPTNVLVSDAGDAVLIDFNLAQHLNGNAQLNGGTLPYMPRRQLEALADGRSCVAFKVSVRDELESFGLVLYEALSGDPPPGPGRAPDELQLVAASLLDARRVFQPGTRLRSCLPQEVSEQLCELIGGACGTAPINVEDVQRSLRVALERLAGSTTRRGSRRWLTAAVLTIGCSTAASVAVVSSNGPESRVSTADRVTTTPQERLDELVREQTANPHDKAIQRQLGHALVSLERPRDAVSHFVECWRAVDDPKDIAMAGYCWALSGDELRAADCFRRAWEFPWRQPQVASNLAVATLARLRKGYDSDLDKEAESLIQFALDHLPNNESVQLAALEHFQLRSRSAAYPKPDYGLRVATPGGSDPSWPFSQLAATYVSAVAVSDEELIEFGMPNVRRLALAFGGGRLPELLGPDAIEVYRPLIPAELLSGDPQVVAADAPSLYLRPVSEKSLPHLAASSAALD